MYGRDASDVVDVVDHEYIFGLHFEKRRGLVYRTIDCPFCFGGNLVRNLFERMQKVRAASIQD